MQARISQIKIQSRIRESLGNLNNLRSSMERSGLMHPILIDQHYNLIAGMRRLTCAKDLGWENIEVIQMDVENKKHQVLLEVEENITRLEFTPEEIKRIQTLLERYRHNDFSSRIWQWLLALWEKLFK